MTNPGTPTAGITGAHVVLGGCDTPLILRRPVSFQLRRSIPAAFRLPTGCHCTPDRLEHCAAAIKEGAL